MKLRETAEPKESRNAKFVSLTERKKFMYFAKNRKFYNKQRAMSMICPEFPKPIYFFLLWARTRVLPPPKRREWCQWNRDSEAILVFS